MSSTNLSHFYIPKKSLLVFQSSANLPNFRLPAPIGRNFERLVMVFLKYRNGSNLERSLLSTIKSYCAITSNTITQVNVHSSKIRCHCKTPLHIRYRVSRYYFYFENSNSNMDFFFKSREDVMTHENDVLMKKVEIFAALNFISRII